MKLHDLHPAPGSRTPSRRVGRGHGSGRGKTAGRGTKGQKSRAGGDIPAWFEGGQTPLHIRTPKLHGFRNRGRVAYAPLNLAKITDAEKGTLITPDVLEHDGLIRDTKLPVKVLGVGDAPKGVTIHAHAFSKSATRQADRRRQHRAAAELAGQHAGRRGGRGEGRRRYRGQGRGAAREAQGEEQGQGRRHAGRRRDGERRAGRRAGPGRVIHDDEGASESEPQA